MHVSMYPYLVALGFIFGLWYLASYIRWLRNIYYPMSRLPGPTRLPIFGTKYRFIGVPRERLLEMGKQNIMKYAPIFCTWTGSTAELQLIKAEYVEIIMNNTVHITKGKQYDRLKPWLGQGLLTSSGRRWFQHRKLITPTFHFKILENFMDVFIEKSQILISILDIKANGEAFDVYPDITKCALDIICETAMGTSINAMSSNRNQYVESIYAISEIIIWRFFRPFITDFIFKFTPKGYAFRKHLDEVHNFTRKVVAERKKHLKDNLSNGYKNSKTDDEFLGKKKRMSFLDLLLESSESSNALDDQDIAEEVDTFMFEGHDTTTAGMCWTLFLLGNHADIQEKVYEEVRNVLQSKSIPSTISELHEMKYLKNVIKESLRLYPSVPFIMRDLEQSVQIGEYKIPAGVQAVLSIYGIHRSTEYYAEPDKFDPDRFLPENSKGRHPYAYIPFSAGPRNCIGQKFAMYEEKTVLATIINRYKITAMENPENIMVTVDLILRPLKGVILKLEKRL